MNNLFLNVENTAQKELQKRAAQYKKWRYKNTAFLLLGLLLFFYFEESLVIQNTISLIGGWGYLGAFIVGIFFASTFTVVPAMFVLYVLAETLNPLEVAVFAGLGGLLADYAIFKFLKDKVLSELKPIFLMLGGSYISRIFKTPYFAWLLPLAGAAIIAYPPVPDELGVGLLGLSKLKAWQFILISFLLNATGIFFVVTAAKSF